MQETSRDTFPYSLRPLGLDGSIDIDFSGRASNDNLALQHTFRRRTDLRVVWGGELRRERVQSPPLYNTDATFVTDFTRLFGSAEWHMAPSLVLNAGAMAEHSSLNGSMLSPRLTLNWQAAEGHTLRAGVSTGGRPPSTFEKYADVRYFWRGQLLRVTTLSDGTTLPERVSSREIGYLVNLPHWGLQADVRAFHEKIDGFIWRIDVAGPPLRYAYVNYENFAIKGLEYQLKWRPWRDAQVTFNQARIDITSANTGLAASAPGLATTLAVHQKLAGGLDLSLSFQNSGLLTLQGYGDKRAIQRTDVRLGAPLRFGRYPAELALVVQNLGQPNPDYRPDFQFQRRAFVTLRMEN